MSAEWSFITVVYNSSRAIQEHWQGFVGSDAIEWIVVDNASTDGVASLCESLGANVIRLNENLGFARANNIGLSHSSGRLVAFVNPDVTVKLNDMSKIQECLSNDDKQLVAPQLLNPDGTPQPNGRGEPYLWYKIRNRLSRKGNPAYLFYADSDVLRPVSWLTGAVVMTSRQTWDRIGGWDESYFLYHEDVELGLVARARGVPSRIIGHVRWVHGWRRAATGLNFRAWKMELRSAIRFYARRPRYLAPPAFGRLLIGSGREGGRGHE